MDSVTQAVLGGAVGYAVLGKKVGVKAALYGAVLGTVPDLDVFIDFGGDVENFTFHRSFSHSLLVQLFAAPLFAWLLIKLHPATKPHFKVWCLAVYLCLSTHALLDTCTVYGTQLLWPLTEYPFGFSNLFIIDPLYTLPLLVSFIAILLLRKRPEKAHKWAAVGLATSSLYIVWSLGAKLYIDNKVDIALAQKGVEAFKYVSTPAPFTTFLWRSVAVTENGYYEIYASILDSKDEVSIYYYPSSNEFLEPISNEWAVQRLRWFTKGLYSVKQNNDAIVLSDLRMGIEGGYVFNFTVGKIDENGTITLGDFSPVEQRPDISEVGVFFDRILDPLVDLSWQTRQATKTSKSLCEANC